MWDPWETGVKNVKHFRYNSNSRVEKNFNRCFTTWAIFECSEYQSKEFELNSVLLENYFTSVSDLLFKMYYKTNLLLLLWLSTEEQE